MLATRISPSKVRPPRMARSPLPVTIRFGASIRAALIRKRPPLIRAPSNVAFGLGPSRAKRPVPPPPEVAASALISSSPLAQRTLAGPLARLR